MNIINNMRIKSAEKIFDGKDMNKKGEISYIEFLSANLSEKLYLKDKLL